MDKKIITIAEIVFALVFVVLMAVFMATINSKGNSANTQLVDTLEMTSGTSMEKYAQLNGDKVKGSEVINACNNYKMIGGDIKVKITVLTGKGSDQVTSTYGYAIDGKYYKINADGKTSSELSTTDKSYEIGTYTAPITTSKFYINPTGDFVVSCEENDNGFYDQITFTQDVK